MTMLLWENRFGEVFASMFIISLVTFPLHGISLPLFLLILLPLLCFIIPILFVYFFSKNRPLADSFIESRCPSVCLFVCLMSPSHAIFSEASHWPSGHMIRSRPLISDEVVELIGGGSDIKRAYSV